MAKIRYMVFSIYSPDIENYPYYPFIAKNVYEGIQQYIKFIRERDKICPNPQLHYIGNIVERNGLAHPSDIQPLLAPQLVELSGNFLSWTFVTLVELSLKFSDYLKKIGVYRVKTKNN